MLLDEHGNFDTAKMASAIAKQFRALCDLGADLGVHADPPRWHEEAIARVLNAALLEQHDRTVVPFSSAIQELRA